MNIKRAAKITFTAILLAGSVVYAKAAFVALPVKVADCDLIANVEILSITQVVWRALKPGECRSRAEVKVVKAIKGLKVGDIYTLEFDNGYICPNVTYRKGEECLVFNRKLPGGHYETYNTYFGKYFVKNNKVQGWKQGSTTPLDEVVTEITNLMQKTKEAPK